MKFPPLLDLSKRLPKTQKTKRARRLRACRDRFFIERLEHRRVLASVSDGGSTTLDILLDANESLSIVSNGTTYRFASNKVFTNGSVAATGDFSAFGTALLTIQSTGISRYSRFRITDSASGASVNFGDSGSNQYLDDFLITLDSGSNTAFQFNGSSTFSPANSLQVSTDASIAVNRGASLTALGGLKLYANNGISLDGIVTSNLSETEIDSDKDGNGTGTLRLGPEIVATWVEQSTLSASSGASEDYFGISVAMSADGNTAIVGAHFDDVGSISDRGSATVFTRTEVGWVEQRLLTAPDGATLDQFGFQVALSADGNTAIVGADYDDVSANVDQGSATVFVRSGNTWTLQAQLTAADGAAGDHFGVSVALSADGNVAFVGAVSDDIGANTNQGSVTSFVRVAGSWSQQQKIVASAGTSLESFGQSIAVSLDGSTLIVGQFTVAVGNGLGSATVFTFVGGLWTQQAKLTPVESQVNDAFGCSVAISADGNYAIVGAKFYDIGGISNQGRAIVFSRSNGIWTQQNQLIDPSGATNDGLGGSVAISADGSTVLVGIGSDDIGNKIDQGSVLYFARQGSNWIIKQRLTASDGAAGDFFGEVALSSDGKTALVGAWNDDVGSNANQGSVKAFQLTTGYPEGQILGQNVRLSTADFDIRGRINASGTVSIEASQPGREINIGTKVAGSLALTESELDLISANTIRIGNIRNGAVTITAEVDRAVPTNLELTSGAQITVSQAVESRGGNISMVARNGIVVNNSLNTFGGNLNLQTDMDSDGVGTLTVGAANDNWTQLAGITGNLFGQHLGTSTAISADGKTAIVGSPNSALVLVRSGTNWTKEQTLFPLDRPQVDTRFGSSVAISADGNTAIIGCPAEAVNSRLSAGTARVFVRANGVWTEQQKLSLPDANDNDRFGASVSISDDGNTAVVVSLQNLLHGSVTVYVRLNGVWTQQQRLVPTGTSGVSSIATAAISADGNTLIVGAPWDDRQNASGSVTVFVRSGTVWTEQQRLAEMSGDRNEQFGSSIRLSADGNLAFIGAPRAFDSERGFVSIFERINGEWSKLQRIDVPNFVSGTRFGQSISVSRDGKVLVVGAPAEDVGNSIDQGTAYLYVEGDSGWTLQQRMNAVGATASDFFGSSVAISRDNKTIMVGAPRVDILNQHVEGSVWIFNRENPGGMLTTLSGAVSVTAGDVDIKGPIQSNAEVSIVNSQPGQQIFLGNTGQGVSISNAEVAQFNAPNLAIGNNTSGSITVNGKINRDVYANLKLTSASKIKVSNPVKWNGNVQLIANDGIELLDSFHASGAMDLRSDQNLDLVGNLTLSSDSLNSLVHRSTLRHRSGRSAQPFGSSIALSADGKTAIIGSLGDDVAGNLAQGSATIFSRVGSEWISQQRLVSVNGAPRDFFGSSVDISDDGNTAIVGASGDDIGANLSQGSATIYVRSNGMWTAQQVLTAIDGRTEDFFGASVALSGDGSTAVVGASGDDVGSNLDQGSSYVFARAGNSWIQQGVLQDPEGARDDRFGHNVNVSSDGNTVIVGSFSDDIGSNVDQGSATVFTKTNSSWAVQTKLTAADGAPGDLLGFAVALSSNGDTAVITAPGDKLESAFGSVSIFSRSGTTWTKKHLLSSSDVAQNSDFGVDLSVNADATVIVAGAGYDAVGLSRNGSATVFKNVGNAWTTTRIVDVDGKLYDAFGSAVAVNSDGSQFLIAVQNQGEVRSFQYGKVGALSSGTSVSVLVPDIDNQGNLASAGPVSIASGTSNRPIFVGSNSSGGIGLSDAELDRIDAQAINLGNQNSGAISVSEPVTRSHSTEIKLSVGTNAQISFIASGSINSAGGNIQLSTSGTGSILSGTSFADIIAGSGSVVLNAGSNGIGASGNPILLSGGKLSATTSGNGNVFVGSIGSQSIEPVGFDAGTGTIALYAGVFSLSANSLFRATSKLVIDGATLDIAGFNLTVAGLSLIAGSITGTTGVLTSNSTIQTQSGFVNAILSGSNGLNQFASGITRLAGANTYSGTTTVTSGTLALTGTTTNNITRSALIDVKAGATLDTGGLIDALILSSGQVLQGNGNVIGGLVAGSGSQVSPGASPGVLSTDRIAFDRGSKFIIELNGSSSALYDQLNVRGTAKIDGELNISLGFTPTVGDAFRVLNNEGTKLIEGAFVGFQEGDLLHITRNAITYRFQISYLGGDGNDLVLTVIESALQVTINPNSISEKDGTATGTITRFAADISNPVTVTLLSRDTTEATVPATIVIPANAASITFLISSVDDDLLDGTQTVFVTANATSYTGGVNKILVTDSEALTLTIDPDSISEKAGTAIGTVRRSNSDIGLPITIALSSSDTSEAIVPTSVTIPANQTSANFTINGVDDNLLDGTQRVRIEGNSNGYIAATKFVDVNDFELLTVAISNSSISENGGATTGTVTRNNSDIALPITVALLSNDLSEISVPEFVTIAANQSSAVFTINAVDDRLLDGPQNVTIVASSLGYMSGESALIVTDLETLSIDFDKLTISELNDSATGTVTRSNTDIALPITITLASSDTTEASVLASVIIPANQASATFQILSIDDSLLDGPQTVTISANSSGYVGNTKSLVVTDEESIRLTFNKAAISENGETASGTVTRSNSDIGQAIVVNLSNSDPTELSIPTSVIIPANAISADFLITAVDDTLLDGLQTVSVAANSTGYSGMTALISVTDVESLTLAIDKTSIGENGGVAIGTVTRGNTDIDLPYAISLFSNDNSEAVVPPTVTIPANSRSASFFISAVDDDLLDGTQTVEISAVAVGYLGHMRPISVTDEEVISLTISSTGISEQSGSAVGTVTRSNTDISLPLTVSLTSSDTTEATVPLTVTIPANQSSASFTIVAVDDSLLDGAQTVTISAAAQDYVGSFKLLAVTDAEFLTVTFSRQSIQETGETTIGTITRSNSDVGLPITVTITNSDSSEASMPATVTIPANQFSVNFVVTAVDDNLLDGTQSVTVTSNAAGYFSGSRSFNVTDVELLTLAIDRNRISENGGTATGTVTRGNSDIGLPITVNLTSTDTSEITVPASVTIAANQSSASFVITAVIDRLLDGTQAAGVVAGSTGYFSDLKFIDVTDAETFLISFNPSSISENGGRAIGTVTRSNTDISQPLLVVLTSNDLGEATVPSTVTIPAGQPSTTFNVTAVDDSLLDGSQAVSISANGTGYIVASAVITVDDSELLTVTVNPATISENGGVGTGRVTRGNTDISQPVVVTLSSSDTSEAIVPASVTILANQAFASFAITAVDDSLLDGSQSVTLSASASGYLSGVGTIQVTDAESLSVSINVGAISEIGGVAIATVTRSNTDTSQPLTINLTSNLTSEATVPPSVTIPANATSADFAITAVDDAVLDGTKTVLITASAAGYSNGTRSIDVTDAVLLSISIIADSISENGGSTLAIVTRSNANNSTPLSVQLLSSDPSEATTPTTVTIPANQSSTTFTISAVDDTLLDGDQLVTITPSAAGYLSGNGSLRVTDAENLIISITPSAIGEDGRSTTGTVTRSNTDIVGPIVITLVSDDTSEAIAPTSVTILAGQASASFTITSVDDSLLDGPQNVSFTASSAGYIDGKGTVAVTDVELLSMTIPVANLSENGGVVQATVSRSNTDNTSALVVSLQSNDTSEANLPATVTIPANQSSVTFSITSVDDALLDGIQRVSLSASAPGYADAVGTIDVQDAESLALSISASTISENSGSALAMVTRSNTDNASALVVSLQSNDTSEANVPATVTIPANQSSVTFSITGVDDSLLDGTQRVSLSASAPGYADAVGTIDVQDAESLALSILVSTISENSGSALATVTRSNTDNASALVVSLQSNDTSEANVPATVTIPANQSSVTFSITGVDDAILDGTQRVTLSASAPGYADAVGTIDVHDAESLALSISVSTISENGGSTLATVTRSNTDNASALVVSLQSNDTSEANVPATVTIPANQSSVTFSITGVDDALLDGTQRVSLSASAPGYADAAGTIDVHDAESLAISISVSTISENSGSALATVTRSNTDNASALVVSLQSNDTSEANVPATITIPANQSSVTFSITGVDDAILDGTQRVTLSASAPGYADAAGTIDVHDAESLAISISVSTISENSGSALATVTRSNTDNASALVVSLQSNDTSEANVPATITIPANQSSVTFSITGVDDSLLDGTQRVSLSASAPSYIDAVGTIDVQDAESLALSISVSTISENGGATLATVTRSNTDNASALVVSLQSSDTSEAKVPATITIPANQSSVTFSITGVDDALLDGKIPVEIGATAVNYASASTLIEVTDSESLSLSIDVNSISENGGFATGIVTRSNTDTINELLVLLVADDLTEVLVPSSVMIPANQSQATFTITSVNDSVVDGTQTVRLTASAVNYEVATKLLAVNDDDRNFPWQNPRNRLDVNDDSLVTPVDALLVISAIVSRISLPPVLSNPFLPPGYVDVNGDGLVTPVDALLVISELNRTRSGSGEGEEAGSIAISKTTELAPPIDSIVDLLADDQLRLRRKRS